MCVCFTHDGRDELSETQMFRIKAWEQSMRSLFIYLFIYLFMAVLGLRFCARAFSSCGKWGPLFVVVSRLLIAVASLVVEPGL